MGVGGSRSLGAVDSTAAVPSDAVQERALAPAPSTADVRMRRLLRVPTDGSGSVVEAQSLFGTSIAISAVRCLITYVAVPLLAPVLDLTGGVGPVLGLAVGTVSMVAIVFAVRRFFLADHPWRWRYTILATGVLILLTVGAVDDIVTLAT